MHTVDEMIRTALETVGVLAIGAGVTAVFYPLIGWGGLISGGLTLLGLSWTSARLSARRQP